MDTTSFLPKSTIDFANNMESWVTNKSHQAKSLWAKSGDESGYLNLPQHLVDSACAAAAVFDIWVSDSIKQNLGHHLGISVERLRTLYIFLAGVHDLGKACKTFQTQLDQLPNYAHLAANVSDSGLDTTKSTLELGRQKMPHGIVSGVILQSWLIQHDAKPKLAIWLSSTIDAHHGIASSSSEQENISRVIDEYPASWRNVHSELLDSMAEATNFHEIIAALNKTRIFHAGDAQLLTGLVVMADWIASNAEAFPMQVTGSQVERIANGMASTDLTGPWATELPCQNIDQFFTKSFGWPDTFTARPVQKSMVEIAQIIKQPSLLILEAETGVGKTEGAQAAAHVLGHAQQSQGIYFAAPTMATANGLLERTINWAQQTTEASSVASLYLAHSKNQLSRPYQELRFREIGENRLNPDNSHKTSGDVVASSWMSGRRRGLLANIVVGTVDQVLMLALQQRYSMLRHTALAGKIIIFDEVHAYDAYTSDYLETTLEWLAFYGASVIMMSATLPPQRRQALIQAYTGASAALAPKAYPLITVANETETQYVTPEPTPTNLTAQVHVIGDELTALTTLLQDLLVDGGCALIICNTIARAQETLAAAEEVFPGETELHHAGFTARDRTAKEDTLRAQLGPDADRSTTRPFRKIVVATQVAEQSLDIDADVLLTDIAPIDLLIQRLGRVHRHQRPASDRPDQLRNPAMYIRGVHALTPIPEIDSGAMTIYDPKIILSTLLHLPDTFRRPDDIEPLVRAVYEGEQNIPAAWHDAWQTAEEESCARIERAHARSKTYRTCSPFAAKSLERLFERKHQDVINNNEETGAAQVRDAEPAVEVIPIIETEYGYTPWGGETEILNGSELNYSDAHFLATSTVRLPTRMTRYDRDFDEVITTLERDTPESWMQHFLLKGQLALRLNAEGSCQLGRFRVRYSNRLGIECLSDTTKIHVTDSNYV